MTTPKAVFRCVDCGQDKPVNTGDGGTGYAKDDKGRLICYACCGLRDTARMIELGRITLYLTGGIGTPPRPPLKVTNWPGTLMFPVKEQRTSPHNIAGKRYDVWFNGPDGHLWHGITYGDNTQLCHCKRTKTEIKG